MRQGIFSFTGLILLAALLLPAVAHADPIPGIQLDNCAPGFEAWDYTAKIVYCVQTSVEDAVFILMEALSDFMTSIVGAMIVLLIAFFGVRIMGGEPELLGKATGILLRIAFVWFFYYNLGGIASSIFDVEDFLIALVAGGSPWFQIDEFLGRLIGVGPPPLDISKGLLGIIGAALFSSTTGGILFFIAISAFINLLMFIFRVVFTYLTAITLMGFLIVISPLIIPLVLFVGRMEQMFNKWLDILISAMLVPVLLFAFLSIAVNGFSYLIDDLFLVLCGPDCVSDPGNTDLSSYWKMNEPKFAWALPSDPGFALRLGEMTGQEDEAGTPAVQTYITPTLRHAHDTGAMTMPGIDFGPSNVAMLQKLIYTFLGLWLFASFMKSIVDKIPEIAYNITEAYSYISMEPSGIERKVGSGMRQLRNAITGWR